MKSIGLVNSNKFTVVDDDVYEWASKHTWFLNKGYVTRSEFGRPIALHLEILKFPSSKTDHRDRDRLNNQIENLRLISHGANIQNSTSKRNRTGFKGVMMYTGQKKFVAKIGKDGKRIHLGSFETAEEAARAYDAAALRLFGPEALTNQKLKNYES